MRAKLTLVALLVFAVRLAVAAPLTTKTWEVNTKSFRAIAVSPSQLSLHWKNAKGVPYRSFGAVKSALQTQGKKVLVLMNAGIYSQNDEPAGLHIEAGKILHPLNTKRGKGNFHLPPNGVFFITQKNQARILSTRAYQKYYGKRNHSVRLATQSGPMLLIDGKINPRFITKSRSLYTRNAVCTTKKHNLWFLISDETTNFYTFAKAAKQLGCYQALYLDGSISKLYQRGVNMTFHFSHYVGILAVTE